ncbi:hypothetical protein LJK88_17285 [Paenibacillus sp. P26]|nr:hypothetical protein LJK88_17285 [Paenibacillus sp. P26]
MLRVYPWLVRFLFRAGRRWWPPSLYSTLIQVSRSAIQYQFIMVFLIITIATGLFSASATRTINKNTTDKIRYAAGADMTMQIRWENDAPPVILTGPLSEEEQQDKEEGAAPPASDGGTSPLPKPRIKSSIRSRPSCRLRSCPGWNMPPKCSLRKTHRSRKGKSAIPPG